ncbi:hypothetical protein NLJ89_g3174 [Agrocybe chaxingu]|uniref:Non-haem dioxygenase N-terminal domain-containing protein n=1 Tax=Agrocybe chaxingu TaxID=84603 RepID=A0A9W8MVR4_9AGAR|nr:hypothetical protein NLJ89_g3174 [Agrocybe chaxingu]
MSSFLPDGAPPFLPHSVAHPYESDVEADLEVDQLDSDTDPEDQRDPAKASATKVTSTRPGERVPGHTLLPAVRIENMIQADGAISAFALSKEGLFILSTASEEFIKRLIQAAHREAAAHRRNQINYPDMAATTRQYQEFMFLSETIPPPIALIDALMLRQEKERALLEDNPALAAPSPIPSWPLSVSDIPPSQPSSSTSKPSKKPRASVNGKEKSNGSHSTSKRGSKRMESSTYPMDDPRIHASLGGTGSRDSPSGASDFMSDPPPSHCTSGRNGTSSLSASAVSLHPPSINGPPSRSQTPQVYSREDSLDPNAHAQPHYPATHSALPTGRARRTRMASSIYWTCEWIPSRVQPTQSTPLQILPLLSIMPAALDQLPIIDTAPLLSSDPQDEDKRAATSAALHSACVEYGFFYLKIDTFVDPSEPAELALLGRQFFALPQEEKDKLALKNQDNARGYQKLKQNVTNGKADNHEGLDFYKPVKNPDKTKPVWGENQWPTVPGFREKYEQWIEKMKKLGLIVMEAMSAGLGMTHEEWAELRNQVDDSFWVMRYPPLPDDHDGISCGAHKDYGCLTFLYADPTPNALQVFLNRPGMKQTNQSGLPAEQGNEDGIWISADPVPGIPFFFEPNFDALVKPLAAVLRAEKQSSDTKHIKKPVVYGEFLVGKVGNNFSEDAKGKYD